MPETYLRKWREAPDNPDDSDLGYPEPCMFANQNDDDVLVLIPANSEELGDEAFIVAMPDDYTHSTENL